MDIVSTITSLLLKPSTPIPEYYHFMVVSALQEEMDSFLKGKSWNYVDRQNNLKVFKIKNIRQAGFNILSYSINKMGMPFNGVAITKIIEQYRPRYVIFIGTCAGLKKNRHLKEGDVLVPEYIYAYDSGKHDDDGKFQVEHRHYDVSSNLITLLNDMITQNGSYSGFSVLASCGFCSGASVISSKEMREKILADANRKVLGFDMEAYVIAVINHLYTSVDTLVIKGIMDFGVNKKDKFKQLAKDNSAQVADDLVKYIIDNVKIPISS